MAADENIPVEPDTVSDTVTIKRADLDNINTAMQRGMQFEAAYNNLRNGAAQRMRVLLTLMIADLALFGGLWLGFTSWREALAITGLAVATEEGFMALITYATETIKRGT